MSLVFACAMAVAVDGDTLRCANIQEQNGRVRLARIDAAELNEAGGHEAKAALARLLVGEVRCVQVDATPLEEGYQHHDRYGRIVARCSAGDRDLGAALVQAGHAARWPRKAARSVTAHH